MNKQEIIEAINSTIVANGQKGITAESLANLLIEMASATPEGGSGGNGSLILYVPSSVETFGVDVSLTEEQQAHNAEVYAKCLECYNNNTSLPGILLDLSDIFATLMGATVKYNETPMMTVFTTEEIDGVIGLVCMSEVSGMVLVSDDGTTIVESSLNS